MFRPPVGRSRDTNSIPRASKRAVVLLAACATSVGLSACGGGERQDVDEPSGEFPVQITASKFANKQRLAQTSDLELGIKNVGDDTIPDLAITISTDPEADESFSIRSDQPDLAVPSRSVWVLNDGFPKLAGETAPAGAEAAQTKTFSFGPVEPGESKDILWKLTPVIPGTYTISYQVAAGLQGKAKAVTEDGSLPEGEFAVRISDVPPQTRVDDAGNVVPIQKGDIIGQAGSKEQRGEVGAK